MSESVISIVVEQGDEGWSLKYAGGPAAMSEAGCALDVAAWSDLAGYMAQGHIAQEDAQQIGLALYRFVIGERAWQSEWKKVWDQSDYVHLRLDVRAAPLRAWPWELLYDEGEFLALSPRLRLSRVADVVAARSFDLPVQVVILASNIPQFQSQAEADMLYEVLNPAQREGQVFVRPVLYPPQQSLAQVVERLRPSRCDVLHLSGHVDVSGSEPLLWLDEKQPISFAELAYVCGQLKPLMVYLNACNGATTWGSNKSPVTQLQQAGVPVILGPVGITTNWAAFLLAAEFYRGLAGGMPSAAAAARARRQFRLTWEQSVGQGEPFEWAGLALYQADAEGFSLAQAGRSQVSVAAAESRGELLAVKSPLRAGHMADDVLDPTAGTSPDVLPEVLLTPPETTPVLSPTTLSPTTLSPMPVMALPTTAGPAAPPGISERARVFLSTHAAQDETLRRLAEVLRSPTAGRLEQEAAVEALGVLGQRQAEALRLLVQVTTRSGDGAAATLRRKAVEQLAFIRDQTAFDALLVALTDPDESVRRAALSALDAASQQAQAQRVNVRLKLPLDSRAADERVSPLRQAVLSLPVESPRRRVDMLRQIEWLRFDLMHPRARHTEIARRLESLSGDSPELKSLALDLQAQIEWSDLSLQGGVA